MPTSMTTRRAWMAAIGVWLLAATCSGALDSRHPLAAAIVRESGGTVAAIVALVATRRFQGRARRAWTLVAGAIALWVVGNIVWDWFAISRHAVPEVSAADVLYLAAYPVMATGLVQMVRLRTPGRGREGVLDGVVLGLSAGLLVWQYVVEPSLDGLHGLAMWVNGAYPLMDVMLLMAVAWLAFAPGRRGVPTRLMFGGLVLLLVVDIGMVTAELHGIGFQWANQLYPTCYLLLALASLHPDADEVTDAAVVRFQPLHPARVAFLGIALLAPPLLNSFEFVRGNQTKEPTIIATTVLVAFIVFVRLAGLLRDRERDQQELTHQASHDGLTGLLNRYLLADRIDHALGRNARHDGELAVLYLDLDRFKAVNDTLGHDAGDALLMEAATRLQHAVRSGDTVARLGGDEFAVLCEDLSSAAVAFEIAQRIVDALSQPFAIGDSVVVVSASVGVAVHHAPDDSAESLLRDADAAMYRAKEQGRHRWEVFDADMRAWVNERRDTEKALQLAVKHGELRLHYQPIVSVRTGAIVGFEALVRWMRPGVGLVAPAEFVPLAEETGLIVPIGEWVLEHACFQLAQWQALHGSAERLHVAINVSGRQLRQASLAESVARACERARVDPSCILLELTESMLLDDADWSLAQLEALKRLGARIAIDDFGTGYSALAYLRHFPIDVVKIDRAFMHDVDAETPAATVVGAVVALSHALGLQVVGEGAETQQQVSALRRLGCDYAQGFFYSRPLAPAEVAELLDGADLRPGRLRQTA